MLKRKKKRRSAYLAKTEPMIRPPEERDEVIEVVDELDSEFVLDMDDIVLEEGTDSDNSYKSLPSTLALSDPMQNQRPKRIR